MWNWTRFMMLRHDRIVDVGALALLCLVSSCITYQPHEVSFEPIGTVVQSTGYPAVIRNARPYIIAEQSTVFAGDVITTDDQSLVQLEFKTDTIVKLGKDSQLLITDMQINETSSISQLTLRNGSLEIEGDSAGNNNMTISTSIAMIETHSESLWLAYAQANTQLNVVSLGANPITISNQDGTQVLDSELRATTINAGSAPQRAATWTRQKFVNLRDDHVRISRHTR